MSWSAKVDCAPTPMISTAPCSWIYYCQFLTLSVCVSVSRQKQKKMFVTID